MLERDADRLEQEIRLEVVRQQIVELTEVRVRADEGALAELLADSEARTKEQVHRTPIETEIGRARRLDLEEVQASPREPVAEVTAEGRQQNRRGRLEILGAPGPELEARRAGHEVAQEIRCRHR